MYKVKETDTHVYFLTGPFSQWFPARFSVATFGVPLKYNCAEQYMMAQKALLFGDEAMFNAIMAVQPEPRDWKSQTLFNKIPKKQKELGRAVKNFDPAVWTEEVACGIVFTANIAKFGQNQVLKDILLKTGDKILVEGASYDRVWGVGLAWNDPLILDEKHWLGTNWLGKTLMRVRNALK